VLDVEHHLALNEQVVVEHQRILREVDRALDGVFDWHKPEIDFASLDSIKHIGHRAIGHVLERCQIWLCKQRLLGEGAGGAEIADTTCVRHLVKATTQR